MQKEIQRPRKTGEVDIVGHDSEEDARAAVELLRLKMLRGEHLLTRIHERKNRVADKWISTLHAGPTFGEFVTDQESIFERLSRTETSRKTAIVDHGNPAQWHGSKADTAIGCKTDAEVRLVCKAVLMSQTDS